MQTQTPVRPNRFPGACSRCGHKVPAEAGELSKGAKGWEVAHLDGECPKGAPSPTDAVTSDGMFMDPVTGGIFKVQIAKHGNGQLYAKRLVLEGPPEKRTARFVYEPGLLKEVRQSWAMTKEQAQAFGKLYGICCVCAAELTDEKSIALGIGPICGGRW